MPQVPRKRAGSRQAVTIETPAQRDKRGRAMAYTADPSDIDYYNATVASLAPDQRKQFRALYLKRFATAGVRPSVDGALEDMRMSLV